MSQKSQDEEKKLEYILALALRGGTRAEAVSAFGKAYDITAKQGEVIGNYIASRQELNRIVGQSAVLQKQLSDIETVVEQMGTQLQEKKERSKKKSKTIREHQSTIDDLQDQLDARNQNNPKNNSQNPQTAVPPSLCFAAIAEVVAMPVGWFAAGGPLAWKIFALAVVQTVVSISILDTQRSNVEKKLARTAVGIACCATLLLGSTAYDEIKGDDTMAKELATNAIAQHKFDDEDVWKTGVGITVFKQRLQTNEKGISIKDKNGQDTYENDPNNYSLIQMVSVTDKTSSAVGVPLQTAEIEIVGKRKNKFTAYEQVARGHLTMTRSDINGAPLFEMK